MQPQEEFQFDYKARDILRAILEKKGVAACEDSAALFGDLGDKGCGRLEKSLLTTALELGVAADLQASLDGQVPFEIALAKGRLKLVQHRAIATSAAVWAVLSWAVALGCITAEEMDRIWAQGQPAPVVDEFSASAAQIAAGGSVTLKWSVRNAGSVTIEPGIGAVAAAGERAVSPAGDTTFRLLAEGPGGKLERSVAVKVITAPAPVVEFSASVAQIAAGGSVTLKWKVQNAVSVTIEPGIGAVAVSGERAVKPTGATTYRLLAEGPGGKAERSVSIAVKPPAPTAEFHAVPGRVAKGGTARLTWKTQFAKEARIEPGIGAVALSGEQAVTPAANTVYRLIVQAESGAKVERSAQVKVGGSGAAALGWLLVVAAAGAGGYVMTHLSPSIEYFDTVQAAVVKGKSVEAHYLVKHADKAWINHVPVKADAGSATATPDSDGKLLLEVEGAGGKTSATTQVSVLEIVSFSVSPSFITEPQYVTLQWATKNANVSIKGIAGTKPGTGSWRVWTASDATYVLQASSVVSATVTDTRTASVTDWSSLLPSTPKAPSPLQDFIIRPHSVRPGGFFGSTGTLGSTGSKTPDLPFFMRLHNLSGATGATSKTHK